MIRVFMCSLVLCSSLVALDIPGTQLVPPSQMRGPVMLIPEVPGGMITTPGPNWEWHYAIAPAKTYMLFDTETGTFMTLTCMMGQHELTDSTESLFLGGLKKGMEKAGGKVTAEKSLPPLVLPTHGKVRRCQFDTIAQDGNRVFTNMNIISVKSLIVVLTSFSPDGTESPEVQGLLSSLKYSPPPPAVSSSGDLKDNLAFFRALGYCVLGGIFWGIAMLINALAGRHLINGPLLGMIFIIIGALALSVRVGSSNDPNAAERSGYEIGAALFPALIFAWQASRESKEKQNQIAQKVLSPGEPPPVP
jgi:hypothetical protein